MKRANLCLTKLGLLLKSWLNLLVFGLFLLFVPEGYLTYLGFSKDYFLFLRGVGILGTLLGLIYTWGALDFMKKKMIARVIYLDALIYPMAVLTIGVFVVLPWSVWLSALLVGLAAIFLIIGRSDKVIF